MVKRRCPWSLQSARRCFVLGVMLFSISTHSLLTAASNTFLDYQNYNHGYCPDCQCTPCTCKSGTGSCPTCPNQPCSSCNGKGVCPNCQGGGACPTCHAQKSSSCTSCQGKGACVTCQGKGSCPSCSGVPPPPGAPPPGKPCPTPNPCTPATTAATQCGLSLWWIGIGIAALVVAAKFIVSSHNGHVKKT